MTASTASQPFVNRTDTGETCPAPDVHRYASAIGIDLAMPQLEALILTVILTLIIVVTIVGNVLVILSVFTHKPLRIVQNFFIVSLAVADLTVAILVLPFNVVNMMVGRWIFGIHLCKLWLTCDVLCCTSSILNLCAIALDRYWAITDPIMYAQKRTVERVLMLIAGVWVLSLVISSPPLIGWNDWPEVFDSEKHPCMLNSNPGYRVYSALGSFFIPLIIMTIVYVEIFVATRRRLRERARASRINAMNSKASVALACGKEPPTNQQDQESASSETNHNEHSTILDTRAKSVDKGTRSKEASHRATEQKHDNSLLKPVMIHDDSVTDLQDHFIDKTSDGHPTTTHSSADDNNAGGGGGDKSSKHKTSATDGVRKVNTVYQFIEEKQKISLSKERRAAQVLGIIMGVFILCWVPFFLVYIILPFCPGCCLSNVIIDILTWLGYINSALNPIIYTIFNLDFRRAFKKLLGIKL